MKTTKRDKRTNIEKEIDEVIDVMKGVQPDTDEYSTMASNLDKLYKAKS